jgi:sugar/nucleoside kinase (ribokinase family)
VHRITIAGHICVDIRPQLDAAARLDPGKLVQVGPVAITLGGAVGNTGKNLRALGAPVDVVTCIGDDELGRLVQAELAADQLMTSDVRVVPGTSTSYSLVLEPAGTDRSIWHHIGANAAFTGSDIDPAGSDLFHLGYPPLLPGLLTEGGEPLHQLLAEVRAAGATTSVDLAVVDPGSSAADLDWEQILSRMLSQTDIVSPSLDDLTSALGITEPYSEALTERLADRLLGWGAAVVALSAGERGLYIKTAERVRLRSAGRALASDADDWADRVFHVPPVWVRAPVTTNGAGDASTAGLLYGIAVRAGPDGAARLAAACSAALVSGRPTTRDAVVSLSPELSALLPWEHGERSNGLDGTADGPLGPGPGSAPRP